MVGAAFVLGLSLLLSLGIRESATANNVFVVLKVSALAVFIVAGITLFHGANLHNFNPLGWGQLHPFGGTAESTQPYGIIAIGAYVFFSYIGFDAATTTAEECKSPQWDVPVGVIGALAIGTLIYCATAIVLVGAVPWEKVPVKDPLVYALAPLHQPWLTWIIVMGVLAGTTSVALSSLLGQTRIFYVMARDKMLPPVVAWASPRFKTPVVTTMITGIAVALPDAHRSAQRTAQSGQHRHVDGLHGRLRRRTVSTQAQSASAPQLPLPVRSALPATRDRLLALPGGLRPLAFDVGVVRARAGRRPHLLF